ncbi:hypothetical protein J6590_096319 [Homalodisca vitripennis]|nr:hypothetical protein J6590_096319 [Homalodisca vitripennis]
MVLQFPPKKTERIVTSKNFQHKIFKHDRPPDLVLSGNRQNIITAQFIPLPLCYRFISTTRRYIELYLKV